MKTKPMKLPVQFTTKVLSRFLSDDELKDLARRYEKAKMNKARAYLTESEIRIVQSYVTGDITAEAACKALSLSMPAFDNRVRRYFAKK